MSTPSPVHSTLARASARAWGIATGLILGVCLCAATLWLVAKGGPDMGQHLGRLSRIMPGYEVSVGGSIFGFLYAFVVGYALGRLLAPRQPLTLAERESERNKHVRLNGGSWGLAIGGFFAVVLAATTVVLALRGGEDVGALLKNLGIYFPGYTVSVRGALIGAVYVFVLGWLAGKLIGAVYNSTVVRAEEKVAGATPRG